METNLEFRKIPSLKFLYEVSEDGRIFRNVKSKKQLKIIVDYHHSTAGYCFTFVCRNQKVQRISISKVVAECWLGTRPAGYEIDHIDRNSLNNHYSNLRYVTHSEQMKNRDHTNISKIGSQNFSTYRHSIMKPVRISRDDESIEFESIAEASRYLAELYGKTFEHIRFKLKKKRKKIFDYDVEYLNAETRHAHSKE